MSVERERLHRLQEMAALIFDSRSQALRQANEAKAALLRQLDDLDAGPAGEGLVWPAAEQARFGYEQWAAARRAEINQRLAAQTVVCHEAEATTRLAFGRQMALGRIEASRPKRG